MNGSKSITSTHPTQTEECAPACFVGTRLALSILGISALGMASLVIMVLGATKAMPNPTYSITMLSLAAGSVVCGAIGLNWCESENPIVTLTIRLLPLIFLISAVFSAVMAGTFCGLSLKEIVSVRTAALIHLGVNFAPAVIAIPLLLCCASSLGCCIACAMDSDSSL